MGLTSRDKTHCVNGHRRSPKNIYVNSKGRGCRVCQTLRNRKLREKSLKIRLAYEVKRSFRKPLIWEIGWAAGCFDGEGTVTLGSSGPFIRTRVILANTDREVVDFYLQRWGGSVRVCKPPSAHSRRYFEWSISGRGMRWFLRDIAALIQRSIVCKKIRLALAVEKKRVEAPKDPKTKRFIRTARRLMRRLNQRGRRS